MSKRRKLLLIIAIMSLAASNNGAGYCGNVVLPTKLALMNATSYYSLCAAISSLGTMVFLPALGVMSRKFGAERVTLLGVIAQFLLRLVAIAVTNPIVFIAIWFFNGVFNAMYITAPYVLLAEITEPSERVKYYGYVAAMNAVGTLVCPLITGICVDAGHMALAFVSYAIFIILPIIMLIFFYPHQKTKPELKLDMLGLVLMAVAVGSLVLLLSLGGKEFQWLSAVTFILLALCVISFLCVLKRERVIENPSVPIYLFQKKRFRLCFICALLYVAYSICPGAYLVMYVQSVMGLPSTISSTVTIPQTIVQAVVGSVIGAYVGKKFVKRFRPVALFSMAMYVIALFILSRLTPTSSMVGIYVATALGGFGCAFTQSCIAPYFQTELRPDEYAAAQGMFTFAASGGASVILAMTGLVINLGFDYNKVFLLCSGLCAVAFLVVLFGFRFTKEEKGEEKRGQISAPLL